MLAARERLSRERIGELMKAGRPVTAAFFDIRTLPNTSVRGAVVVSKKVAHTSVGRHKMKRRVYSALRAIRPQIEASDILIIVKKTAKPPTVAEYKGALMLRLRVKNTSKV